MTKSISPEHKAAFKQILHDSAILTPSSTGFDSHTKPWSLSYDQSPLVTLVPSTVDQVKQIVKYLYDSDLDFAIRGRGNGNSSASDVVLSMRAFDKITFDEKTGLVDVGAGCDWGEVDVKLATLAPGYIVVGARCPYVGVAGSTLAGGLSWTSHELGLGSDPKNMLDAEVVLADGRAIWASQEPELLWALRGGGGNFGVVTKLRLKAHKYTTEIFSGTITFPVSSLHTLSQRVSRWTRSVHDPKMAMHIFVADMRQQGELHGLLEPQLISIIYDANGEEHGRSEQGFKWALDVPGAELNVGSMPLSGVHGLQKDSGASHGTADSWLQAALISDPDEELLVRGFDWYNDIAKNEPDLILGTFFLLEIMQEPAFTSSGSTGATAWPHFMRGRKHVLQLSVGGTPGPKEKALEEKALKILHDAPALICKKESHPPGDYLPNFPMPFFDMSKLYEGNWDRLRKVKRQYDPQDRFNKGGIVIPPA